MRTRKFIVSNSFFKSEKPGNKPAVKKHINSIIALQSGKASGLGSQISLASVSAQTYPPQTDRQHLQFKPKLSRVTYLALGEQK